MSWLERYPDFRGEIIHWTSKVSTIGNFSCEGFHCRFIKMMFNLLTAPGTNLCSTETASNKERKDFWVEIDMMKKISEGYCNNIVNMVGCVTLQEPLCLITEFVPHGDLLDYLRNQRKKVCVFSEGGVYPLFRGLTTDTFIVVSSLS